MLLWADLKVGPYFLQVGPYFLQVGPYFFALPRFSSSRAPASKLARL